jgi:hypothetical protein
MRTRINLLFTTNPSTLDKKSLGAMPGKSPSFRFHGGRSQRTVKTAKRVVKRVVSPVRMPVAAVKTVVESVRMDDMETCTS